MGWIYAKTTVTENTQTWSKRGIRGVGGQMALLVTGKNIYKQTGGCWRVNRVKDGMEAGTVG